LRLRGGGKCFHGRAQIFDLEMGIRSAGELHVPVPQDSLNAMDIDAGAK
jgi:hypothetical protein